MPIKIEILDSHAKLLVEFYIQRVKTLKAEILEKEKEAREIYSIIQKLNQNDVQNDVLNKPPESEYASIETDPSSYSDKWTWVKKIQYAMNITNKPLTTREIIEVLTEHEADFIFDRKRVLASVSSTLSTKSGQDKEFLKRDNSSGEFTYSINPEYINKSLRDKEVEA